MSQTLASIEPQSLWTHFTDLNAVPRPSKHEDRVIAFIKAFGESLNLPTTVDHAGNVIIKKPASLGMGDRMTVAVQSHLDMVHQKNNDRDFDFNEQGIEMILEDDWIRANGTTLGADNGIGVAAIMALLNSTDIPHPPLEALFTIDEETGMTGAFELKGGLLDAQIMLNLDTEDDDELTIGCAGGIDVTATGMYNTITVNDDYVSFELNIKGLSGGHSGMDIHKGFGNSNKLMNRLLFALDNLGGVRINAIEGGSLRNAIPRESRALLWIQNSAIDQVNNTIKLLKAEIKSEYAATDPDIDISVNESNQNDRSAMNKAFQRRFIRSIYACPNGIYRMSPSIKDLVQTSNNLARVEVLNGVYKVLCLTRSSVESEKMDEAQMIRSVFELIDAEVNFEGSYPGWTPNPDAPIVTIMKDLYIDLFKDQPKVNACHAGLECGILGTHYPEMQMISFGPNIRGAHSPDEKVQISSVQKFWKYLLATLQHIPIK